MRFAFCLYNYFPYSGLSRDMARILRECRRRGHEVHVFARQWQGPRPDSVPVTLLNAPGLTNHSQCAAFHRSLRRELAKTDYDAVIGFNKMPGLDIYYAADDCYVDRAARLRSRLYGLTPRYHHLTAFESAVFSPRSKTIIMLIAELEKAAFQEHYGTPNERFRLLPPTLDRRRRAPRRLDAIRERVRSELGAGEDENLVLLVGSGFKTKGLDRAIRALAALPAALRGRTRLFVVGQDKERPFARLARRLGVRARVHFLGGRQDVPELLQAGDLLIHPAYNEAAGTILLESITSGLPVLATDICGYAPHVAHADAGMVLPSPFRQEALNERLREMLTSPRRESWSRNGLAYGDDPELYAMPERAVDIIEQRARQGASACGTEVTGDSDTIVYLREDVRRALAPADGFDDIMALEGQVYREAPGRHTVRVTRNGQGYFLKVHTGVGWREIMKNLLYFRLPVLGATNEWHGIHRLRRLTIDTMSIAGYGTSGRNPARRRSFIITDELADTISLEDFCRRWTHSPPADGREVRFKRWLISKLAGIAQTMHTNGANHRDFYLCHFLLELSDGKRVPEPGESRLYVIDLHRMQLRRRTPTRWSVKDISGLYYSSMELHLTSRDLFRFMRAYSGKPLRDCLRHDARFWRRVHNRARNLYAAERRKASRAVPAAARTTVGSTLGR